MGIGAFRASPAVNGWQELNVTIGVQGPNLNDRVVQGATFIVLRENTEQSFPTQYGLNSCVTDRAV